MSLIIKYFHCQYSMRHFISTLIRIHDIGTQCVYVSSVRACVRACVRVYVIHLYICEETVNMYIIKLYMSTTQAPFQQESKFSIFYFVG